MLQAAESGAALWAAYAAVETIFAVLLRRVINAWLFVPPHPAFALFLLILFPLIGALLTVAGAAVLRRVPPPTIAAWTLAIAFVANTSVVLRGGSRALTLGCALIILIATTTRLRRFAAPWATALLLVVPVALVCDIFHQRTFTIKAAVSATAVLLILGLAWLAKGDRAMWRLLPLFAISACATLAGMALHVPSPRHDAPTAAPPRQAAPNIVIIVMDTVRADHTSLYGYARNTTPFLRSFAAGATLFRHAYAPGNMTLSSHASLFTGQYPSSHGAHYDDDWEFGRPLSASTPTLAETLSARGYSTASVASNYGYLGTGFGLDRGFQYHDARPPDMPFGFPWAHYLRWPVAIATGSVVALPLRTRLFTRGAEQINESAFFWLASSVRRGRPFFLFVNYMDAHSPCIPPPPFDHAFARTMYRYPVNIVLQLIGDMIKGKLRVTDDQRHEIIDRYDSSLAYIDHSIGALVARLQSLGIYDNTLLVITADHGESFGEHGAISHGWNLYEEEIRIPLLIKAPGQRDARVETGMISLVDIWKLVGGSPPSAAQVIGESFPMRGAWSHDAFRRPGRAVITQESKFIENVHMPPELYDLTTDLAEVRNLAARAPDRVAESRKALEEWRARIAAAKLAGQKKIDPETERTLRSLGYIH